MLFIAFVAVVFLAMMLALVVAHEMGHYLAARMFGMGAEEFAVGLGGKPFTYLRVKHRIPITEAQARAIAEGSLANSGGAVTSAGKFVQGLEGGTGMASTGELVQTPKGPALEETTAFTVRPLPFGGFVRIKGMVPEEDGSETQIPGGFYSKPPWQRLVVLFAGPLFSVLAGVLVLIPYFMLVGEPKPDPKPIVGIVAPGSVAEKAGIKERDVISSVDGKPVGAFYEAIQTIRERAGKPTNIVVNRGGQSLSFTITPERDKEPTVVLGPDLTPTEERKIQGKIGVGFKALYRRLPLGAACTEAVSIPFEAIGGLISAVLHPKNLSENVGGPETMIRATADAARDSWTRVVSLAALLSISIGIFNLLPFPPLDGGQMAMALAEMLRGGRRLSIRAQSAVILAGLAIVGVMVLSVIVIDFQRYSHPPAASKR
jgi:regulator of sigma E protease